MDDVQVSVLLGQVKLSGAAASAGEREAAARLAASVPGVESVVNQLEVRGSGRDVPEVA